MIAAEILHRQIAARQVSYNQYAAGLKRLEGEYILLKGLMDAEAAEIASLTQKLKQLGTGQPVQDTPMHPLQAAVAQQGFTADSTPPFPGGYPAMFQVPPAAPAPPRGLTVEDIQAHPQLANHVPPAGYQHSRQDPYGTEAVTTNQQGIGGGDVLPRGEIKDITPPLITRDMEQGV